MLKKWLVVVWATTLLTLTSCATSEINNPHINSPQHKQVSALFVANNRASGNRQLWRLNNKTGSPSPFQFSGSLNTGDAQVGNLVSFGGFAIFTAYHPEYGRELWRTDGSEKGTYLLKDTLPGPASGMNDYQHSIDRENPLTSARTEQNEVFFWSNTTQHLNLWKTDGTAKGTRLLKVFPRSKGSGFTKRQINRLPRLITFGSQVFFRVNDGQHGLEFWHSDGTKSGTKLLVDASEEVPDKNQAYLSEPDSPPNSGFQLTEKHLYFVARSPKHHDYKKAVTTTLWRVAKGATEAVKFKQLTSNVHGKISPPSMKVDDFHSNTPHFTGLLYADEESVYYYQKVDDGKPFANGSQVDLWVLDVATKNTKRISRLGGNVPYNGGSTLYNPSKANDFLYFWYSGSDKSNIISELWRTNGDDIQRIFTVPGIEGHQDSEQYVFADKVFFAGSKSYTPPKISDFVWYSDSKSPKAAPIALSLGQKVAVPYHLRIEKYFFVEVNNHLLFSIPDEKQEKAIVRAVSKEKPQQASIIGSFNSFIPVTPSFNHANDELLFINGNELWLTNGTQSGTRKIKEFSHNPKVWQQNNSYWISGLGKHYPAVTPVRLNNGKLLFTLNDQRFGSELWVSDNTTQGTKLVKDINTTATTPEVSDLIQVENAWYFISENRLWFSDGSQAGSMEVKGITDDQVLHGELSVAGSGQYGYILTRRKANLPDSQRVFTLWRLNKEQAIKLKVFSSFALLSSAQPGVYITQYINSPQRKERRRFVVWKITDNTNEPVRLMQSSERAFPPDMKILGTTKDGFLYSVFSPHNHSPDTYIFDGSTKTSKRMKISADARYFNTSQHLFRVTSLPPDTPQAAYLDVFDSDTQAFKALMAFPDQPGLQVTSTENGLFLLTIDHEKPKILWYLEDGQQTLQLLKSFPMEQTVVFAKSSKQHVFLSAGNNEIDYSLINESQLWISDGTKIGTRNLADSMRMD